MPCITCGGETRSGSARCPACEREVAERWRAASRSASRQAHHVQGAHHRHDSWWWQRRLAESRAARSSGTQSTGALYALAAQHREMRAHEGVLWGIVALLVAGSMGVDRVWLGAGGPEQAAWALAALAAGLLGARIAGERESVTRMLVIAPIGVVVVGIVALAVESGAVALAIVMPAIAVLAVIGAHLTVRRRRENRPVARQER